MSTTNGDDREEGTAEEAEDKVVRVDFGARRRIGQEEARQIDERQALDETSRQEAPVDETAVAKLAIFRQFIDRGMVMVTLDATRPGVHVPDRFAHDEELRLNFSHRFGVDDFTYDTHGVRGSLSFGGVPFYCIVPWSATLALYSHPDQALVVFEESALPQQDEEDEDEDEE